MAIKSKTTRLGDSLYEDKKLNLASFPAAPAYSNPEQAHDFKEALQTVALILLLVLAAVGFTAGIVWVSQYIGVSPEAGRSIFVRVSILLTVLLFLLKARITGWKGNTLLILIGLFWSAHPILDSWAQQ